MRKAAQTQPAEGPQSTAQPVRLVGADGEPINPDPGANDETGALTASESQPLPPADTPSNQSGSPLANALAIFAGVVLMFTLFRAFRARRAKNYATNSMSARERIDAIRADARGEIPSPATPNLAPRPTAQQSLERTMADAAELSRRIAAQLENRAERLEQLIERAEACVHELDRASMRARPPQQPAQITQQPDAEPAPLEWQQRVHQLAASGTHPRDIAREVNKPIGQVELIIKLRRGLPA